jgi:hypothetical protein
MKINAGQWVLVYDAATKIITSREQVAADCDVMTRLTVFVAATAAEIDAKIAELGLVLPTRPG